VTSIGPSIYDEAATAVQWNVDRRLEEEYVASSEG
jgi:hypothetical protein